MARFSTRQASAVLGSLLAIFVFTFDVPVAQEPAGRNVALVGARVIDGTGAPPLEQATILIRDGRIQAVGTGAAITVPAGATRVDLSGKTIMPGLINSHAHFNSGDESLPLYDRLIQQLRLYAQYGVTSLVSLGDDGKESLRVRDGNAAASLDRARLFVAGEPVVPKTVDEARQLINAAADKKVDIIKTRMNGTPQDMTSEVYTALLDQAHKRGLKVAAHLYYLQEAKGLVNAGLDIIAHSIRDQDVDEALIAELKRRNIGVIPTLTREVSVFVYESTPDFVSDPFFLKGVTFARRQLDQVKDPAFQEKYRQNPETQAAKKALDQASRNLKRLSDAGVLIAFGTDTGAAFGRWQGYFEHLELELMVKAGMTPMRAIVAATGDAAKVQKFTELGTIQAGRHADLVVLNANPLTDIKNTRQIHSVWIGGRQLGTAGTN
jgi:imidazolonepropionase-like amidohydrolase